jgi:hypothetical protein
LRKLIFTAWLKVGGALLIAACGAPPPGALDVDASRKPIVGNRGENGMTGRTINERFRTLDDYLSYLERTQGPVDGPWYRLIKPGVYELQTGNLRVLGNAAEPKRIFTREELEREFGFSK